MLSSCVRLSNSLLLRQERFALAQFCIHGYSLSAKRTLDFGEGLKREGNQCMNGDISDILWLHTSTIAESTQTDDISSMLTYKFDDLTGGASGREHIFDDQNVFSRDRAVVAATKEEAF